jgi:hypothetical protein
MGPPSRKLPTTIPWAWTDPASLPRLSATFPRVNKPHVLCPPLVVGASQDRARKPQFAREVSTAYRQSRQDRNFRFRLTLPRVTRHTSNRFSSRQMSRSSSRCAIARASFCVSKKRFQKAEIDRWRVFQQIRQAANFKKASWILASRS